MQHQVGHFKNADNLTIFHQSWLPEERAQAVILLVHGLGEHSGRYQNLLDTLVPQGYAVHALDHIGHGRSDGPRKYINSFDEYTATLHSFSALVREQYNDVPVFLLGHSMGGLIASRYLLDYQDEFNGAVLSAPAVKVTDNVTPLLIWLGRLLAKLTPRLGLIPIGADRVSRDPLVVKAYLDDPLVYNGKTSARLAAEIVNTMDYVVSRAQRIELPLMIVQGSDDQIVNPQGAQLLFDAVSSEDKTLEVYEGLYHEVFNEPERTMVLKDVLDWLEQKSADAGIQ